MQATCIKHACIQFPAQANTLKHTCIKQAPDSNKQIFTIHKFLLYTGWTVYCRPSLELPHKGCSTEGPIQGFFLLLLFMYM